MTVGIAGQHIRSLQHSDYITRSDPDEVIEDADIESLKENVHKLVMMPGEEIIHVLPQEYKIDGQAEIREPRGMYGGRLEANFHIVVGQVASIKNIFRCVTDAGLKVSDITLEPLASAEAVLSQGGKEAGVVLVDIGWWELLMSPFLKMESSGILQSFPFGGNVITEDIKEGCSIIEKQAELLKSNSALPGQERTRTMRSSPFLVFEEESQRRSV